MPTEQELQAQVDALTADLATANSTIASLEDDLDEANETITTLTAEKVALEARITEKNTALTYFGAQGIFGGIPGETYAKKIVPIVVEEGESAVNHYINVRSIIWNKVKYTDTELKTNADETVSPAVSIVQAMYNAGVSIFTAVS